MEFEGGHNSGISGPAMALIGLMIVVGVAGSLYALNSASHYRYIAKVTVAKIDQSTSYNSLNIIKDGAVVTGLGTGLSACMGETLGLCAAAVPTAAGLINAVKDDPIMTVTEDALFTNTGNGTASNVRYAVETTIDGKAVSIAYYDIPSIPPGQSLTVSPTYSVTFAQVPAALWSAMQGKENIGLGITSVTYDGGA